MKAIFINSAAQTVTPVDFTGNYKDIQRKLGVRTFTVLTTAKGDSCYADDEGLLNETQYFFQCVAIYPHPIAGNALILGCDDEGDDVDCKSTVDDLGEIKFFTKDEVAKFYKPTISIISW